MRMTIAFDRRSGLGLLVAAGLLLEAVPAVGQLPYPGESPVRPFRDGDLSIVARNILPPGQGRYLNAVELLIAQGIGEQPAHNTDQLDMYDSLVQGAPGLTEETLVEFFKDASFGVPPGEVVREDSPRDGVVILRDSFGVPHVYGETREDVAFGAGYVSAEDRLFMMDVLRHLGRARLSELLGPSPGNLAMDRAQFRFADYTEGELQAMIDRLEQVDSELGALARQDFVSYVEGINAFILRAIADPTLLPAEYPALQIVPRPWRPTDVVAAATVIGDKLGAGGGSELRNAVFLDELAAAGHSPEDARAIFDDFRFADDPESVVTTDTPFVWNRTEGEDADLGPVDPAAVARPDPGSLVPNDPEVSLAEVLEGVLPVADGPFGPIPLSFPDAASNALLVTAESSETGRPIAVYGPQTGYWSPQILMEIGLYGPGFLVRGAGFPGLSLYALLGRGASYAWSATSAGGDQVDVFAKRLCDPDGGSPSIESAHYVNDEGDCVEMVQRTDTFVAKPSAGGVPESPDAVVVTHTTQRTEEGIVQMRGTVGGAPVAFVARRASYGAEVDSALAYVAIHDPERVDGFEDLQRAFHRFSYTFNWFLLDGESAGWQLGGYHPLRTPGVDPDLPVWGTGEWAWRTDGGEEVVGRGFHRLSFERTPKDRDPAKGFLTNWNNRQAPGFRANDGQWSFGPVDRSQPLDDRIEAAMDEGGTVSLVELTQAMADAATVDLRGDKILPVLLRVLESEGAPDDLRLADAISILEEWNATGAHRRDLSGDGAYDHAAAVALMDEWWSGALAAVFRPVLGDAFDSVPLGQHDAPGPVGSAFNGGWYGQLEKDLRTVLGEPVEAPFSRVYCGEGELAACRDALLSSLDQAVAALEAEFGPDPTDWDAREDRERIQYEPLGVQGQRSMQWQNRPTFQQILEFSP